MAKKVATTVYITEEQQEKLKDLNLRSRVPIAEFVRQGIDLVLQRYEDLIPGQLELNPLPPGQNNSASSQSEYATKEHS